MPTRLELLERCRRMSVFEDYVIERFDDPGMDGDTPFHWAAYDGDVEALRVMLEDVAAPGGRGINLPGDIGDTPLHYAVMREQVEAIEFLLSAGADPHAENEYGERAMDYHSPGEHVRRVFARRGFPTGT